MFVIQTPFFYLGLRMYPIRKKRKNLKEEEITMELLQEASVTMAEIVQRYGDMYLPIFIRILKEIEKRKEQQSYKEIALQMLADKL